MSQRVRKELLPRLRQRYGARGREGRTRMLNELCDQFGYSRKHAIKLLGGKAGRGGDPSVFKGRPRIYTEAEAKVLWAIWQVAEQPCGKRLVALLKHWLPYYEAEHGKLGARQRKLILGISPAQVDRLLAPRKVAEQRRRRCGTKPGGLLRQQIPIRTTHEEVTAPGWLEADSVAHCGGSMEGSFVWSVTYTDIFSGWTCLRGVWNKGEAGVVAATREVEESLPFALEGFDCDNGSEFLNWHLVAYLRQGRRRRVKFTRSRPYHKDDNGHVEQKNWTHVRQLLGYGRLEDPELLDPINRLYRECWEPLNNFFLPSAKLVSKTRRGGRVTRVHDDPMTPCDRLLGSSAIDQQTKAQLRKIRAGLNPFELKRQLEEALKPILSCFQPARRPPGSLPAGRKNDTNSMNPSVS